VQWLTVHLYMVSIEEPVSDTELVDTDDPSGSLMTMVTVFLGVGIFFALANAGQATVTPIAQSIFGAVPGVETSEDTGLIVEG